MKKRDEKIQDFNIKVFLKIIVLNIIVFLFGIICGGYIYHIIQDYLLYFAGIFVFFVLLYILINKQK